MDEPLNNPADWSCPLPIKQRDKVVIGHGSGGKMTHDLIRELFWKYLGNETISSGNDAAVIKDLAAVPANACLVISTDSHVVSPLFFPGGDIGRLAVCGTVNDLAMMGAQPRWLTAGFILEEGLELEILERILASMQKAAQEAGIKIIAGDTKVVQKGKGDGLYINTAGVGYALEGVDVSGDNAQPGDLVILSGEVGNHGIAVLSARGELGFEATVQSDVAPLNHLVSLLLSQCQGIHVMRDPPRGGLATALKEIANQSNACIMIEETKIPVMPAVASACELLGFDPLYVANEGKLIAIVHPEDGQKALEIMRSHPAAPNAQIIGEVKSEPARTVLLNTAIGTTRIVDMLSGELIPRIC